MRVFGKGREGTCIQVTDLLDAFVADVPCSPVNLVVIVVAVVIDLCICEHLPAMAMPVYPGSA